MKDGRWECAKYHSYILQEKAGLSLGDAERLKDRLVNDNEIIELKIDSDELAQEILERL